jgi:long-chain fatty acid transport protein
VNVPFDWTHSFLYEVGATYTAGLYDFSAGYIYSENSVPSATFSPIIPDSARNVFSVGVGRSFGSCTINLAYQLGIGGTRTIVNDSAADGRYSFLSNAVSISLGYHF